MQKEIALKLIDQNKQVYNKIAYDFSNTRNYLWQDILPLLDYSKKGDKVLDLGCGNGRLFAALKTKGIIYTGSDNSEELLKIAKEKHKEANFVLTDNLKLPFQDNSFDLVYCIAVLHHIPSKELRAEFLTEAKRTLKKGGLIVITVWQLAQRQSFYLTAKFAFLKIFGKNKMDFGDVLVPWQNKYQRYVHNFRKKELKKLFLKAGFKIKEIKTLVRGKNQKGKINYNLVVVAEKAPNC